MRWLVVALVLIASSSTAQTLYLPHKVNNVGGLSETAPEWLYTNWSSRHSVGSPTCSQPMIETGFSLTSSTTDLDESANDCGGFSALSPSTVTNTSVSYPDGVVTNQFVMSTRNGGSSGGMQLNTPSAPTGDGTLAARFYVQYPSGWPASGWDFYGSSSTDCLRQKLGQIRKGDGSSGFFFQPELKGGGGELSADLLNLGGGFSGMNPGDDIQTGSVEINVANIAGQLVRYEYKVDADGWGTSSGTVYDVAVRGTIVTGANAGATTTYQPNYGTFPVTGVDLAATQADTWIINGYLEGQCGEGSTAPKYGYAIQAYFPSNTSDYWIGGACEIEPGGTGCP